MMDDDLDRSIVPEKDEDLARKALIEVAAIALGPTSFKNKLAAAKIVLDFTKQKPATKVDAKVGSLEAWLADVNGAE